MTSKSFWALFFVLLAIILGANSFYVVNESQRALKLRFKKAVRPADSDLPVVYEPGLHFKMPFVEKAARIDARMQTMDGSPDVFTTSNKQFLDVDTYVQWKIVDFATFYVSTISNVGAAGSGNIDYAEDRLEELVDNGLRNAFGQRTLQEAISGERTELMNDVKESVNKLTPQYGIEVVDIRVKKVNYTAEVVENVYEQIKSERKAKATDTRSKGQEKANVLVAETDADVQRILAKADEYSRRVRGEADAESAKIYADSYNKNPEFYAFLRSLDAYKTSFSSKDDILVIQPDSEFFRYLKDAEGKK
ncbi:protease modulator HflC [Pleionea sp. CnH1-48]|uniref:protease modulator HflC n=1 Tax=Pleionea sp. CnH1-48 TaxID=2954494 RepID=UPI002096FA0F|nr:protease modulator HflC [Pleionea sp. CnH1-48]MCO7224861.1 protease modulator HflC [Pleionea sp. CnH1-48]